MKSTLSSVASGLVLISLFFNHVNLVSSRSSPKKPLRPGSEWTKRSHQDEGYHNRLRRQASGASCATPGAQSIAAPKSNIWSGLTDVEAASVTAWLYSQQSLNLTLRPGDWDNAIAQVELMPPNKTDVLSYLDNGGLPPVRYAHVVVDHRASTEPYFQDLIVGPLPVQNGTTKYEPLTYPYTKKDQGRVRNIEADYGGTLTTEWWNKIAASIQDITLDLWNGTAIGLDNDTLYVFGIEPQWQDDGIVRWDQFRKYQEHSHSSSDLLPLGLYFCSNVTGRDPSKWTFEGWFYNNIFYATTEEFRAAYHSPGFEKLPANIEGSWTNPTQNGEPPPLDTSHPPVAVAPAGSRYSVDQREKYVKWMDFEFYISYDHDRGMRIYDIKYKGKRIIYELGLEEAIAHYAGHDPIHSSLVYLDSYYGIGEYGYQLVPGYDCPEYATYMNTSFFSYEQTYTHINSICLFESTATYPIQRHTSGRYVSSTKNVYFTVRNICTVGNYDYLFDYSFYMDGSIHVEVRASGYIDAAYWAHNGDYGYHIHEALSGGMHDHVLNFKLDMDVLGTANTLMSTALVPATEVYPWSKGKARNTMKLARSNISSEDEGKLFWAADGATTYSIANFDHPNALGEPRGYRIVPGNTAHLTVQNSSSLVNAANWASHDLYVTKQKDTEPRSAHPLNVEDTHNPPVNFDEFFDGENLVQEDIVVWFNLGMHHVPHTGDLPNTVYTTAHSDLKIVPLNYLASDPSRETVNQVVIDYKGGKVGDVDTFGQKLPTCAVDMASMEPDLYSYTNDFVIRKFPYDPNNAYFDTD